MTGILVSIKKQQQTENKGGYLENNPFFDWQSLNCFEQWSDVFVPILAKKHFGCVF